jgi:hypothetical protein
MSQQSDMADEVYHRLAQSEVSAAELVQELRRTWGPGHSVGQVHRFVEEVAACLLRDDVELGDRIEGRFVPCRFEPWDPHFKLQQELMAMDTFFDDQERYVFRRTPTI